MFLSKVAQSTVLHHPWVSPPSDPWSFGEYLARIRRGDGAGFFVRIGDDLAGVVNINNIVMGAFRSGHLGYYAFAGFEGRGIMSQGLRLVIEEAFSRLGLHRLEANIQPGNLASIHLVERAGFVREGFSANYLLVDGEWRDHERWAIASELFC